MAYSSDNGAAMISGPADVERVVTVLDLQDEVIIAGLSRLINERNDFRNEVERLTGQLAAYAKRAADAEAKLQTGQRVFGDILTHTGTARPNRKKLSFEEATRIREMNRAGYRQATLADMFDVNPATISRIVRKVYHSGAAA